MAGLGRLLLVVGAAAAVAPASAEAQVSSDPAFHVQAAQLYARSQQRGIDQGTNPDYLQRVEQFKEEILDYPREESFRPHDVDPYRLNWGCNWEPAGCVPRGEEHDFEIPSKYGARMHGHLSLPLERGEDPLPAVIMLTGGSATEHAYRGLAQGLAEAGYAVLGMSVQGDYGAQFAPPDPVPATPENEYCRPHDHNGWQQPAEMGLVEQGECAGQEPVPAEPDGTLGLAALVASHGEDDEWLTAFYEAVKPRKTLGALYAVKWLLSDANPYRGLIDPERIGIMGHSLGAHGAVLAGNADPERRFKAVVSLDGYGPLRPTAMPTVPTMFQMAEGNDFGPHTRQPLPLRGHVDAELFRDARVDTMVVSFAGSTHQEFNYIPFPFQQAPVGLNASRDGERVSLHYALAWFDRWIGRGQTRKAATGRLLASTYDDRVDRSSIGQGPFDPVTGEVEPPTIAGETVADHLSPLYESWAAFDRIDCPDLREGCD